MDAIKRSILGYQVSDNRGVEPCILAMRMALRSFKDKLPENFRFIADGYSAYQLAAQQFFHEFDEAFKFDTTKVIGLTNDDATSIQFRPFKQMIERLNRTYKASCCQTNGFDNLNGAYYDLALWVTYYNFPRPADDPADADPSARTILFLSSLRRYGPEATCFLKMRMHRISSRFMS